MKIGDLVLFQDLPIGALFTSDQWRGKARFEKTPKHSRYGYNCQWDVNSTGREPGKQATWSNDRVPSCEVIWLPEEEEAVP